MTSKIRIVADISANCQRDWQIGYWQKYFDIVPFDPNNIPRGPRTVFIVNYSNTDSVSTVDLPTVIDHLWDSSPHQPSSVDGSTLTLRSSEWMWINEYWGGIDWGYNQERTNDQPDKLFLMPLNLHRQHRDQLVKFLTPWLDKSVWSYVEKGRMLPNDTFVPNPCSAGTANDRVYLPEWYSSTCFSVVSETSVTGPFWISEKTFKPLSYQHPFVIQGHAHTLDYLRNLGFETFGSVFSELYDTYHLPFQRLEAITELVSLLNEDFEKYGSVLQNKQVKDIVKHNYNLFWNQQRVEQLFEQQIVNVITEFVEQL